MAIGQLVKSFCNGEITDSVFAVGQVSLSTSFTDMCTDYLDRLCELLNWFCWLEAFAVNRTGSQAIVLHKLSKK